MATPVLMPKQGQSVESCIITEWYKKPGEAVKKGDTLFAYETDKASFEEPAPADGTLLTVFYDDGDEVPVLTNVAVIGQEGESTDEFQPGDAPAQEPDTKEEDTEKPAPQDSPSDKGTGTEQKTEHTDSDRITISPRAKNKAKELLVDYTSANGTGPGGRIIERDVDELAEKGHRVTKAAYDDLGEKKAAGAEGSGVGGRNLTTDLTDEGSYGSEGKVVPLSNIRKIIAKGMHASLQNSAQLTHHMSADARNILAFRKTVKSRLEEGGENITLNDVISYCVIKALKKHPDANVHFMGDSIRQFNHIHLGLAVDTERGLMVPALRNAGDLTLGGLSRQLKHLADSCKKGNIDPELLASTAATFTISNLGSFGVEMFTPVINLPQAGILGVNTIIQRPGDAGNGVIGFIPYLGLSLTYDHRVLDGAPASRFLRTIKEEVENFSYTID